MALKLHIFMAAQNWFRCLVALSERPRTLRELAALCEMSPAGTQDLVRRLVRAELIQCVRQKRSVRYHAHLGDEEIQLLKSVQLEATNNALRLRAERFSEEALKRLSWIDEMLVSIREAKKSCQ